MIAISGFTKSLTNQKILKEKKTTNGWKDFQWKKGKNAALMLENNRTLMLQSWRPEEDTATANEWTNEQPKKKI